MKHLKKINLTKRMDSYRQLEVLLNIGELINE
jgi:hypothetical protein